jgi:hypothetical protein
MPFLRIKIDAMPLGSKRSTGFIGHPIMNASLVHGLRNYCRLEEMLLKIQF